MELVNTLLKGKRSAGVEFIFQPDGSHVIHCLFLKKDKSSVKVERSCSVESLQGLKEVLSDDIPVYVSFNGKGSIHKKVSVVNGDSDRSLLHKVLPNANPDDFFIQRTAVNSEEAYVSVFRKDNVDSVLRQLSDLGIKTVGCSFGPFGISTVLPLLNNTSSEYDLKFSGSVLSVINGKIEGYKLADTNGAGETVTVGTEQLQGNKLVAFSSALRYFVGDEADVTVPLVKDVREEFRQKQLFRIAGTGMLLFFFVALLVNYFLFTHFSASFGELSAKVENNKLLLAGFEKMKKEVFEKERFLEQTGLLDASRTSFYADRLAMDMPASIRLSELNINPVLKKNKADDTDLEFTSRTIKVLGACDKSIELNEWIKMIRQKDWVKDVSVLNYSQAQSKSDGEFSLEINIK